MIKLIPFFFSHLGILVAYHSSFVISGQVNKENSLSSINLSFHKHIISYDFLFSKTLYLKIYTYFNQK
jgi:hypothetical protein